MTCSIQYSSHQPNRYSCMAMGLSDIQYHPSIHTLSGMTCLYCFESVCLSTKLMSFSYLALLDGYFEQVGHLRYGGHQLTGRAWLLQRLKIFLDYYRTAEFQVACVVVYYHVCCSNSIAFSSASTCHVMWMRRISTRMIPIDSRADQHK